MNLYSIKTIKELLKAHNTTPKERLGQNFLLEKRVAVKMLRAAELSQKDTVLEIGPGIGTLTQELAKNAGRVVAIEKDPAMVEILQDTVVKECPNVKVLLGDVLKIKSQSLNTKYQILNTKYKVVANLPYYITSPVMRLFLETVEVKPQHMVFMVQKEVAQRICAKPPDMNLLAVSVQFFAEPKIVSFVRKGAFWPRPKVDSAILRIAPLINADTKLINTDVFFKIVKAGFKQPRKQLGNNLAQGLKLSKEKIETWLSKTGIQPTQRAETLSLEDWVALAKSLPKT